MTASWLNALKATGQWLSQPALLTLFKKPKPLMALVGALFFNYIITYDMLLKPALEKQEKLKQQVQEARTSYDSSQEKNIKLANLNKVLMGLPAYYTWLEQGIPSKLAGVDTMETIRAWVGQIAQQPQPGNNQDFATLSLLSLEMAEPEAVNLLDAKQVYRPSIETTLKELPAIRMDIKAQLQGSFYHCLSFLNQLSTANPLLIISNLSLAVSDATTPSATAMPFVSPQLPASASGGSGSSGGQQLLMSVTLSQFITDLQMPDPQSWPKNAGFLTDALTESLPGLNASDSSSNGLPKALPAGLPGGTLPDTLPKALTQPAQKP